MALQIVEFTMEHYQAAYSLWAATPGMGLSEADGPEAIQSYLVRNSGTSFAAMDSDGNLVGTVLCGHDGRRGYLYHLAVRPEFRGRGIGEDLVTASLDGLRREHIDKCHIMVLLDNLVGQGFWNKLGWLKRHTICVYSSNVNSCGSAASDDCPC